MRERCRDLVGRSVRLVVDLKTHGGKSFKKGTIMRVTSTHRGRYSLAFDDDPEALDRIRGVRRERFAPVEKGAKFVERPSEEPKTIPDWCPLRKGGKR